jgi:ABC-type sugar transport system ATPase subunit
MLELNEVLVAGADNTVSMMARERQVTCLTGGSVAVRSKLLLAMLGLVSVKSGFVSIDGEPLEPQTVDLFRGMMAYVPSELRAEGEVVVYEPPTVQDVFNLKHNREAAISNGLLTEEMKRTGAPDEKARLLAVAVLRKCPILLVDTPHTDSADYLRAFAAQGHIVVVSSDERSILDVADEIVEV